MGWGWGEGLGGEDLNPNRLPTDLGHNLEDYSLDFKDNRYIVLWKSVILLQPFYVISLSTCPVLLLVDDYLKHPSAGMHLTFNS